MTQPGGKIDMLDYAWACWDHEFSCWAVDCWVCRRDVLFPVSEEATHQDEQDDYAFAVATANRHNKERHDNH